MPININSRDEFNFKQIQISNSMIQRCRTQHVIRVSPITAPEEESDMTVKEVHVKHLRDVIIKNSMSSVATSHW